ncbi:MAG TPA: cytochrome c [Gaiellaceae bacterium]
MVSALSTGHEIGLAVTGASFIVFALVSSFVLPRANPNFPGAGRNWYLLLCVAFFVAMMSAVLVFGREKKEAQGATGTTTTATAGNAAAGKTQFTSSGCVACHTFKPAGATAKIGPDLDNLAAYAAKANQPVDAFATSAIENPPPSYVPPGFPTNTMPKLPLTPAQVANLVAFLTS